MLNFIRIQAIEECGLRQKWIEQATSRAYKMFFPSDDSTVLDIKQNVDYMELDELNICLGPYTIGICIALVILLLEIVHGKNITLFNHKNNFHRKRRRGNFYYSKFINTRQTRKVI